MANVLERVLRVGEGRTLRRLKNYAEAVNHLEDAFSELTDDELRDETVQLRERYSNGESLDDLLPEAFAAVREATKRTLGMRPFDVQLMGGAALHLGNIAWRVSRELKCDPKNGHILGDAEATKLSSRKYEPGWEPKV